MKLSRTVGLCVLVVLLVSIVHGVAAAETFEYLLKWGDTGTGNSEFSAPSGIARDPAGNIYVADTGNNRVQKFTPNGSFVAQWGSGGSANGQFAGPTDIAIDTAGNVLVADYGNSRIQKFSSGGTFLAKWGSYGAGNGQFNQPLALAVDSANRIIVADELNNRIQVFSSTGVFLTAWGAWGTGNGQFKQPGAVAVDAGNNIYIGDINNHRVQKFNSSGTFVTTWGSYGTANGQFNHPWGIEVDSSGNILVCDGSNSRVQKFTSNGTYLTRFGVYGSSDGQFRLSGNVAVDPAGNIFVTDKNNNRVQKFARAGSIVVDSVPKGAKVFLDKTDTKKVTPCTLTDITRGQHLLNVTLTGYVHGSELVQVATAQETAVLFELRQKPGSVAVTSDPPGASIFIDGTGTGNVTPATIAGITPGSHDVYVTLSGYATPAAKQVQVLTGKTTSVLFTLIPSPIALPGCTLVPTDPDGDGIYEDLNGNGRLDFADLPLFFDQMTWIAENEPVSLFDLNRNGRIDFADIVMLFNEI